MKRVAIICEYNPIHTGHEYQINKIREEFGADTEIIALMSGNFTQRGDIAFADKYTRAKWAVMAGVNLVLMLPFPFSMSSAEFFAKSSVEILNDIGVVDVLSFGSEIGDIEKLKKVANNFSQSDFLMEVKNPAKSIGYAKFLDDKYRLYFEENVKTNFFTPNNILAVEYIKALSLTNSNIKSHTVKRVGADYNETEFNGSIYQSASSIRENLIDDLNSALNYIPNKSKQAFLSDYIDGEFPCDAEKLAVSIISFLRLNCSAGSNDIHDMADGLYNRLRNASFKTNSFSGLIKLAGTKKFTNARLRRVLWYSYLGVTSSMVKEKPQYTQVLAMDNVGQAILKNIKKHGKITVITKPSSVCGLNEAGLRQKQLNDKADSVFQLTKPRFCPGDDAFKRSPFVLK